MDDDETVRPPGPDVLRRVERERGGREARAGAFDAFYGTAARRVIGAVYAVTGDLPEAQDCAQEAFARAWERWDRVADHPDPEAWVRLTARRIAVSRWRRTRRAAAALVRHGAPRHQEPPDLDGDVVLGLLARLPPAQRQAIVLHHVLGFSIEEVARETGAPVGTVKARLSRGRVSLAGLVERAGLPDRRETPPGSPGTPDLARSLPFTLGVPR